jgi:hypothetical protein
MNDRDHQRLETTPPEKLRAALSRLHAREITVPAEVDDFVLRTAREHLDAVGQSARVSQGTASTEPERTWAELFAGLLDLFASRRWMAGGVATLMILAVAALVWLNRPPQLVAGPEDLNADGVVDMLDAFGLARELQHNPASHPQLDLNRDGNLDERDVRALATRAVSLEQGGRS